MIVGIYNENQVGGSPVGTISLTKTGKIKVETVNKDVKEFFKTYITQIYGLPANSRAYPEDSESWVANLPNGNHNAPYYFVIQTNTDSPEEDTNDNEETIIEETIIEEYDEEDRGEETDDSVGEGDSEDGGDNSEDGGDDSDNNYTS